MSAFAMSAATQLTATDGHCFDVYCADAAHPAKGGIVVLQEAFGVNAHIRSVCDDYSRRGYTAIAPALYDRQRRDAALGYHEAALEQARALRRGLQYEKVLLDVKAAVEALRPSGRVAVVGYCVGGSGAWLAASRVKIDAAACYYPSDMAKQVGERPHCPVTVHFAERDHFIPLSVVAQFRAAHPDIPAFVYSADQGFNCSDRSHGYDAASAALALERTLALIEQHVARALPA